MATYTINVNGKKQQVEADADTPLLWVLRDNLGLVGTKFGCGMAQCGACTVHIDGSAMRSCILEIATIGDKKITTIEGYPKMAIIRYKSLGQSMMSLNAAIVKLGKS